MTKSSKTAGRVRVLVVDDSATMRAILVKVLESDPDIEVVGTAHDAYVAREKLVRLRPDMMTLDLELPRMHGLEFLQKVMQHLPTRTLVISNHSAEGSQAALRALECGAVDVMGKPQFNTPGQWESARQDLIARVKMVAGAKLIGGHDPAQLNAKIAPQIHNTSKRSSDPVRMIAIASSTGGTEALKNILPHLPSSIPPIVIVQHMPAGFTKAFANRLSDLCPFKVHEVRDGDVITPGSAYLAPGDFHFELQKTGGDITARLHQAPPLHGVRPAADFLLKSVARLFPRHALGIVLTGMGRDGADGLLEMHRAGCITLAQDEKSSVVYGMPKAAWEAGAVQTMLSLEAIPGAILRQLTTSLSA